MNIYEYAMQMEKDGESYYRELAEKVDHRGLRNICIMLADAEVVHYDIFRKMQEKEKVHIGHSKIMSRARNIFLKMKEEEETATGIVSEKELYKKAQEIEKKSRDFYLDQAGKAADADQKDIFLKIADEERKHYLILERIIDFVSRPEMWLENPEWYHQEEY
jgi:rubrerythrin